MFGAGFWAMLRLFGEGALDGLLRGLSAALKWLSSDWRNLFVVVFGVAAFWQGWVAIPARDRKIADTEALLTDTQAAFVDTIVNFTAASAKAQADAEANVIRVRLDQEKITDATVTRYRADLGSLRARFDRLRARDAAAGAAGRADPAGLPGAGDTASGAAAPTGEDRLPAPGALSLDDALIASEQALQLNALIDWVEAQAAVRFTPEGKR